MASAVAYQSLPFPASSSSTARPCGTVMICANVFVLASHSPRPRLPPSQIVSSSLVRGRLEKGFEAIAVEPFQAKAQGQIRGDSLDAKTPRLELADDRSHLPD